MPASSAWSGSTGSSVSGSASSSTVGRCTATRGASASRSKPNSAAGINPAAMKVADMTLGLWRKVFNVNLEGPLRMSQCVAPVMRDNGGGSIVHIGTMGAYYAGSDTVAYGASKAALKSLTVTMAVDWAPWKGRRLERIFVDVVDHDVGAGLEHPRGDREADATGRAGHHGVAAGQAERVRDGFGSLGHGARSPRGRT